MGGTVGVVNSYARNIGGREEGYAFRFGSDGSTIVNTTIVDADVAVANLFDVGSMPGSKPNVSAGLTVRNVDIVNSDIGVQLGSHQADFQRKIDRSTVTRFSNVRIDAGEPIQRNLSPRLRGSYSDDPAATAPVGVPYSARRAASGVGGGTGSIGGPVMDPGGILPEPGVIGDALGGAVAILVGVGVGLAVGLLVPAVVLALTLWWVLGERLVAFVFGHWRL